jgi:hypothetical protein
MAYPDNNDVNSLIGFFQGVSGFQRSNRFKVVITVPQEIISKNGIYQLPIVNTNQISLFATTVQIPQQVITYFPDTMSPSGAEIDIPLKRGFDERFIIDFIVDSKWQARRFFEAWMNIMFINSSDTPKFKDSIVVNYQNNISSTVDIYALDQNGNTNRRITLYQAWPSTLLPTQMMNDAPNDYLTLSVDMNYRYYKAFDATNGLET